MQLIRKIAQLLGFKQKRRYVMGEVNIKFYKEANYFGEHGKIVVTRVKDGLYEVPVSFVFMGMTTPPKMSDQAINFIFDEARHQGFIPHYIEQYGSSNNPHANPIDKLVIKTPELDSNNLLEDGSMGAALHQHKQGVAA